MDEKALTEQFNKSAGITGTEGDSVATTKESTETKTTTKEATTKEAPTTGMTGDEPRAPQGPVEGAHVYTEGTPVPQVGGVHPSNLGEYGIVSGQLTDPPVDPVRDAQEEAEAREDEPAPETEASDGKQEIGEPQVHGS